MNISEVVPFLAVKDVNESIEFYVEGLGFEFVNKWIEKGELRWCHLKLGGAGVMLQQFETKGPDSRRFSRNKGEGITLCFFCDDAVEFYHELVKRKIGASEPFVGNALWVTRVKDPDGYDLLFESATEIAEDTKLSELR